MPVYQAFLDLALDIEKTSRDCGPDFRWLRVQMLRSSESVCANMAKGFYAQYSTEYVHALYRCRREARETMTHISYAQSMGQISKSIAGGLEIQYQEALKQLANVTASIERKIQDRGKGRPEALLKEPNADYANEQDNAVND